MILNFFTKVFGSSNDRILKKLSPMVQRINDLEPEIKQLSDADMA
jgi:preprotein translocase subunit SecA